MVPNIGGIRSLVNKKMTKTVKFMGEDIKISKLSVAEVLAIQETVKQNTDDKEGLGVLKIVIRSAVEDAAGLTDDEFEQFPLDEMARLSNEIMKFSGLGDEKGK